MRRSYVSQNKFCFQQWGFLKRVKTKMWGFYYKFIILPLQYYIFERRTYGMNSLSEKEIYDLIQGDLRIFETFYRDGKFFAQ